MEDEYPLSEYPSYEQIRWIDRKKSCSVLLARDVETEELVAIKLLPRGPKININVKRELLNHVELSHPHVIKFHKLFLTRQYLAVVMEYAPGGDLHHFLKSHEDLSESTIRWIFQQLIVGLDYIHKMGVVNRDIKLRNILLDDSQNPVVKICDFGLSKHEGRDSVPHSNVGTQAFTAPEILFQYVPDKVPYCGKKADIWSAGVVLHFLVTGQYLYEYVDTDKAVHEQNIKEKLQQLDTDSAKEHISLNCKEFVKKMLVFDPESRPTIAELQKHPWYIKDLPSHALSFNNTTETQNLQSEDQIKEFFEAACIGPTN